MVTQLIRPTYQSGQISTVQRWLSMLGDSTIAAHPPLAQWLMFRKRPGRGAAVAALLAITGTYLLSGASFGAFHACNVLFRRPDLFDTLIAMSGFYDLEPEGGELVGADSLGAPEFGDGRSKSSGV